MREVRKFMKKSRYIALICGGVSIVVTVMFYLMTFDNIFMAPMRWISLLFLIISEVIFIIKAFNLKKAIFALSGIVTSCLHIALVLTMSIVFVDILPLFMKQYVLLNIMALGVLLIVDVLITYFGKRVSIQNVKLSASQSAMQRCLKKADVLCVKYNNSDYQKKLQEIAELLKYSDNSCLSGDEKTIMKKLDEVDGVLSGNKDGIDKKLNEIKNMIDLRSVKVAGAKRGKY